MNKSNNRFLLILVALMLVVSPLRGMSASSPGMTGNMAASDSGCPHISMDEAMETGDSEISNMQMDCYKNDCNSEAGCDNSCFSCVHASTSITGPVVFVPVYGSSTSAPILLASFSNHSFSPPLRPPAILYS